MVRDIKRDANDIFAYAPLRFLFLNKRFVTFVRFLIVGLFLYALYLGFFGDNKEAGFTTALFWSIFWPFFMFVTLPTLGSIFCGICPHGFLGRTISRFGLQKKMPQKLANPLIGLFIVVLFYWSVIYIWPGVLKTATITALFFTIFTVFALAFFYIYKDMAYCKSLCPIGAITVAFSKVGFAKISTYAEHCAECKSFECAKACEYKLSPFNFEKRGTHYDCKSCMDCADACDAVKFEITKPMAGAISDKTKKSYADVITYITIAAVGTITMGLHHGLGRTGVAPMMPWSTLGEWINGFGFGVDGVGAAALLVGIASSAFFAFGGIFAASKLLKKGFNETLLEYGYVFAPIMIIGGASHALSFFFTHYYHDAVNGFIYAFNIPLSEVKPLATMRDGWIKIFTIFNFLAVFASLYIAFTKTRSIKTTNGVKSGVFLFLSSFALFYLFLVLFRIYAFAVYGPLKCH